MKFFFLIAVLISLGIMIIPLLHRTTEMPSIKLKAELNQPLEIKDKVPGSINLHIDKIVSTPTMLKFGWQVEIRSFTTENANEVAKALIVAGFPAYIQQAQEGKTLTTIVVGPKVRKQDAEKLQETLQENFKLNGVVVRYDPV